MKTMNYSDQNKSATSSKYVQELCSIGRKKEKYNVQEQKGDTGESHIPVSNPFSLIPPPKFQEEKSAMLEFLPRDKNKTWKDKLSSSEIDILTMKLLQTLEVVSTSKEKDLKPFWKHQTADISKKLWLPTEIDSVDSVLNSSNGSSSLAPMGESWFSIKRKLPPKRNLLETSSPSLQSSLRDSMGSAVVESKRKLSKSPVVKYKTLKIRLFPTRREKDRLQLMMEQFRWYYNSVLTVVYNHHLRDIDNNTSKEILSPSVKVRNRLVRQKKFSNTSVRNLFMDYRYVEQTVGKLNFQEFKYEPTLKKIPIPPWWQNGDVQPHNRLPRGAIDKFVWSLNSCISNFRNKNIKKFSMNYLTKKNPTSLLHFEDGKFPSFIRTDIKSRYWYRTKDRKRKSISLEDIYKTSSRRSIEILYEKDTDKYFLFCPVEVEWYPDDDLRLDSQDTLFSRSESSRVISLDPGIRKFLVGYDPDGKTVFIGENSNSRLIQLLHTIDKVDNSRKRRILWKSVKNLVEEMHWKSISFLVQNYDTIILPDFRVSQMIRSRKLTRMTKRLMCMYSFHQFRQKLEYKCSVYGKKLLIVDESYTSCTCGFCGTINRSLGGSEHFTCLKCSFEVDRDVNGSRNILLKTLSDLKN